MKYIDVDRLRKEIDHRIDILEDMSIKCAKNNDTEMHAYYHGKAVSLQELLSFIDSFQQEQPFLPNDLDEAAKKWCKENNKGIALCADKKSHYLADGMNAFKAGAKWQYQKDRGEFAKIKAKTWSEGFDACKEQMMNEAVEGEIQMRYSGCLCAKTIRAINEDKFKFGDKVRIIIVREEK